MGSLIEDAATPLEGFNTGFIMQGHHARWGHHWVGADPAEREAMQWARET